MQLVCVAACYADERKSHASIVNLIKMTTFGSYSVFISSRNASSWYENKGFRDKSNLVINVCF